MTNCNASRLVTAGAFIIMNLYLHILWNALLTSIVVSLISSLFLLAASPTYLATATVSGSSEEMLLLTSADLLAAVLEGNDVQVRHLENWKDTWLERKTSDIILLRQSLTLSHRSETGWIEITIEARDPETATLLANAIAQEYVLGVRRFSASPEQRLLLAENVTAIEDERLVYIKDNLAARDLSRAQNTLDQQFDELLTEEQRLRQAIDAGSQQLVLINSGDMSTLSKETGVQRALKRRDQLRLDRAQLIPRYGDRHKRMIAINAEIATAENMLAEQVRESELRVKLRVDQLAKSLVTLGSEKQGIADEQDTLDQITLDMKVFEDKHGAALRAYESGGADDDANRYSAAIVPDNSLGLSQIQLLALIFIGSFLVTALLLALKPSERENAA